MFDSGGIGLWFWMLISSNDNSIAHGVLSDMEWLNTTLLQYPDCVYIADYSIHVPGWLLKWLNLITAHSSVSSEPGSVTWLASKYLKTISWRNHIEKLTTLQPQNISFWPKMNIPSSYFTILMLNCMENTLKLQFDSYVTAVKFLT